MRSLIAAAALSVFAACAPPPELCEGFEPPLVPTEPRPDNGFFHTAHAHNDYEHERPLQDALDRGFTSVEVDVWFRDGDLQVSHDIFSTKGTLDALYLQPLAERLADRSSVHDDGAPFFLWIDIKENNDGMHEAVREALSARDFLSTFDDVGVAEPRAVTVILTGDAAAKTALVDDEPAPRPYARDDNALGPDDDVDPTVIASALNFGAYVGSWDGTSEPPEGLARQTQCVVQKAHDLGRMVRLFAAPDTEDAWSFLLNRGVDFLNSDDLDGLAAFLESR